MPIIFRVNWLLTRQSFVTSLLLHPKPHSIMYSTPGILAWQMRLHFLLNVCRIHRVSLTFNSNISHCVWVALFCAEREIKTVRTIYIMKFTWELPHQTHSLLLFLFVIIVRRRPLVDFVWKEGNLIYEYFPSLLCIYKLNNNTERYYLQDEYENSSIPVRFAAFREMKFVV